MLIINSYKCIKLQIYQWPCLFFSISRGTAYDTSEDQQIIVIPKVNSFTPQSGSTAGKTEVTITGRI